MPVIDEIANRVNSQGRSLGTIKSRSSRFYTNVILPGQILPVPCAGTQFYVTVATAPFFIRPKGGDFSQYTVGTGLQLVEENAFDLLEVKNTSNNNIVFQIFVGFDEFIDKRTFLAIQSQLTPNVSRPTYPTPNAATAVAINDISGQQFTDINGNAWWALAREAIIVSNPDTGVTLLLQKAGSVVSNGPAVAAIYPLTSLRLDIAGNYSLSVGGGTINAVVSEIYQSLAVT